MAHTQDIVEQLRDRAYSGLPDPLLAEAADEIVRLRAWVNELQLSKVEIDALQHVVEDGRFVDLADYGRLRLLLVRLRPEWEGADRSQPVKDAESDRSKPINADRLATASDRVVPLYRSPTLTDAEREAVVDAETLARMFHDEYERRAEELGYETRPDTRRFDPTSINGRLMVATCRAVMERISPQPTLTDAEREAVKAAARIIDAYEEEFDGFPSGAAATLRGLLERMK